MIFYPCAFRVLAACGARVFCVSELHYSAVDITLVPLDAAKHVEDSFRVELESYLRVHGHDVVWVPSGAGLTILLHQPEQRVNPSAVLDAISSYGRAGTLSRVVFFVSIVYCQV